MLRRHVHGSHPGVDDPLITYNGTSTAYADAMFLYADRQGSIVLQADSGANSTAITAYDEYGIHSGTALSARGKGGIFAAMFQQPYIDHMLR